MPKLCDITHSGRKALCGGLISNQQVLQEQNSTPDVLSFSDRIQTVLAVICQLRHDKVDSAQIISHRLKFGISKLCQQDKV